MVISGVSPMRLVEMVELQRRTPVVCGFTGTPEFKSRPTSPAPLFREFARAAIAHHEEIDRHDVRPVRWCKYVRFQRGCAWYLYENRFLKRICRGSCSSAQGILAYVAVERGLSHNTLDAYERDLNGYSGWLSSCGIHNPCAVTQQILETYIAELREIGLAPASWSAIPQPFVISTAFCGRADLRNVTCRRSFFNGTSTASSGCNISEKAAELLDQPFERSPRHTRQGHTEVLYGCGLRVSEAGLEVRRTFDEELCAYLARIKRTVVHFLAPHRRRS